MLFQGGFTFTNFIADAFTIFMFILWFWLLIVVSGDLFRRHDVSGFAKVLWVIAFILFSYIGVFAYLLTQGRAWPSAIKREPMRPSARRQNLSRFAFRELCWINHKISTRARPLRREERQLWKIGASRVSNSPAATLACAPIKKSGIAPVRAPPPPSLIVLKGRRGVGLIPSKS